MKRAILLTSCLLAILSAPLLAQGENLTNQSSAVPDSARFEVVQPPSGVILAIRLDRFTGDTWLVVPKFVRPNTTTVLAWQQIKRIPAPNDPSVPGKVNYQVFLSGPVTVLMNTTTGASWELNNSSYGQGKFGEGKFWEPMD